MSIATQQHRLIDRTPFTYSDDVRPEEEQLRSQIRDLMLELQEANCTRSAIMNERMGCGNVSYVHLDGATYAYPIEETEAGTYTSISRKVDPAVNPEVAIYEGRVISTAVRRGNDQILAQAYVDLEGKRHAIDHNIVGLDSAAHIAPKIFYSIPEGKPLVRVDNCGPSCTKTQAQLTSQIVELEGELGALQSGVPGRDQQGIAEAVRDFSVANHHLKSKIGDATTAKAKQRSTHLQVVSAHARYLVWFALALVCVVVTVRYRIDGSMGGLGAGILLIALLSALWAIASWISSAQ